MNIVKSLEKGASYNERLKFWNDAVSSKDRVYQDAIGNLHRSPDRVAGEGYVRWNWQEWNANRTVLVVPTLPPVVKGKPVDSWRNRQNRGWDNED